MSVHFHQAAVVGIGLIGSSLARVLRQKGLADRITGAARSEKNRKTALDLGVVDEAFEKPSDAVKGADIVFVCTPVGSIAETVAGFVSALKTGAIVSDVGSVKAEIIRQVKPFLTDSFFFVPGHPVAGTEKSGPENGFAELFEGRWCILTPEAGTNAAAVAAVREVWELAGMKVEEMSAERHDKVMALMSHLPHLIAYTIVGTAADLETETREDILKYAAGGFRDFTRIAGSDPVMWRDIFLNNTGAVLDCLQRFSEDLTVLQKAIRQKDGAVLQDWFSRTRKIRREVIDMRQAQPENEKLLIKNKG
ncbi:MAG: prephenate/arogenate dehydrogenase family protein [Alphaproteobacteria bacterium]|nr:prephenate/arogenate dehydrogenase family protein [Alphaproteobacteria bacterium]